MRQYHHTPRSDRPRHRPGEIVMGSHGNWLENPQATGKARPWVLLQTECGQHVAVGLTTQPRYLTSGRRRPEVPHDPGSGLAGKHSYLWSSRPSRLSRHSVHRHLGWASPAMIDIIERHVHVSRHIINQVREVADDIEGQGST